MKMDNDELSEAIEESLTDEMVFVSVDDDEIVLNGTFEFSEIVTIMELLKKEGRL